MYIGCHNPFPIKKKKKKVITQSGGKVMQQIMNLIILSYDVVLLL